MLQFTNEILKMQWRIGAVFLFAWIFSGFTLEAQIKQNTFEKLLTASKSYVIFYTTDAITVDGKSLEKSWQKASWSDEFVDIEGTEKPTPAYNTRFKMLWDRQSLYVYAELEEPHIWAYYDTNDMIVFHENDFEIFLDPTRDTHNYYEFEINAQNVILDLVMNKPYRSGGTFNLNWNAEGFTSAVHLDGSLNDPSDTDTKWCVEMQIPFSSLSTNGEYVQPEDGSLWKINFSRVQWQTEVVDGKYVKKKDRESGKNLHENNWVWSPQGVINMHYPERWGLIKFSEQPVGSKVEFELPDNEVLRKYLWEIFYHQQQFRRAHKRFATSLNELEIPESGEDAGRSFQLKMKADSTKFQATLTAENGMVITIDQEGFVQQPIK